MRFTSETVTGGVSERLFTLGSIPGVLWSPAGATGRRPLVLIAHGGGQQHKKFPGVVARAHRYVTACGFTAAAIDMPWHGGRPLSTEAAGFVAEIQRRMAAREPATELIPRYNTELSVLAVPEWRATLDALTGLEEVGTGGPVGLCGLSMGAAIGILFAAADPRITAAVFGLAGGSYLEAAAGQITIPVEFAVQWDDELLPREWSLSLFSAFGSQEKTLHANPGAHREVPAFEVDSSARFFARHLGGAAAG